MMFREQSDVWFAVRDTSMRNADFSWARVERRPRTTLSVSKAEGRGFNPAVTQANEEGL